MIKLFRGGDWHVALRRRIEGATEPSGQYDVIDNPGNGWIADPFLFEHQGRSYLFFEYFLYSKEKGTIGYSEIIDGKVTEAKIVLEEQFHLSYPVIFEHNNNLYMIPESGQGRKIALYKSVRFPDEWERVDVIKEGANYADTSLISLDGDLVTLLTYEKANECCYLYEIQYSMGRKVVVHETRRPYDENYCRPGGQAFIFGGTTIIPIQDCRERYGKALGFFEYLGNACLSASPMSLLLPESINLNEDLRADRMHTYNFSSNYEVVDVFVEQFDLFHAPKMLRRVLRTKKLMRLGLA